IIPPPCCEQDTVQLRRRIGSQIQCANPVLTWFLVYPIHQLSPKRIVCISLRIPGGKQWETAPIHEASRSGVDKVAVGLISGGPYPQVSYFPPDRSDGCKDNFRIGRNIHPR